MNPIAQTTTWRTPAIGLLLLLSFMSTNTLTARAVPLTLADIATVEAGMDGVYSQSVFGSTPIDIRMGALQTIIDADLASVDTNAELLDVLFDTAQNPNAPLVNMFFVDSLFGPTTSFGATFQGHNAFIVETDIAILPVFGPSLNAHELGHSLGLTHDLFSGVPASDGNLMFALLTGGTTIEGNQRETIFDSPLVQGNAASGLFIEIQPYQILASAVNPVPLPAALPLFAAGLGLLGLFGWRKRRVAAA